MAATMPPIIPPTIRGHRLARGGTTTRTTTPGHGTMATTIGAGTGAGAHHGVGGLPIIPTTGDITTILILRGPIVLQGILVPATLQRPVAATLP